MREVFILSESAKGEVATLFSEGMTILQSYPVRGWQFPSLLPRVSIPDERGPYSIIES